MGQIIFVSSSYQKLEQKTRFFRDLEFLRKTVFLLWQSWTERSYSAETGVYSKVWGLAHRKQWYPERPTLHTGGFLLVVAPKSLYY
jgi:hypothetical protein